MSSKGKKLALDPAKAGTGVGASGGAPAPTKAAAGAGGEVAKKLPNAGAASAKAGTGVGASGGAPAPTKAAAGAGKIAAPPKAALVPAENSESGGGASAAAAGGGDFSKEKAFYDMVYHSGNDDRTANTLTADLSHDIEEFMRTKLVEDDNVEIFLQREHMNIVGTLHGWQSFLSPNDVFQKEKALNYLEQDPSLSEKYNIGTYTDLTNVDTFLQSKGCNFRMIDAITKNPYEKGLRGVNILSTAGEADGGSKMLPATALKWEVESRQMYVPLVVRNFFEGFCFVITHTDEINTIMVQQLDKEQVPKMTDDAIIRSPTLFEVNCSSGMSVNSLSQAVGRITNNNDLRTGPRNGGEAGTPVSVTLPTPIDPALLFIIACVIFLIKTLTDWMQAYFAAYMWHVHGIKILLITNDGFLKNIAARLHIPFLLFMTRKEHELICYDKNALALSEDEKAKIRSEIAKLFMVENDDPRHIIRVLRQMTDEFFHHVCNRPYTKTETLNDGLNPITFLLNYELRILRDAIHSWVDTLASINKDKPVSDEDLLLYIYLIHNTFEEHTASLMNKATIIFHRYNDFLNKLVINILPSIENTIHPEFKNYKYLIDIIVQFVEGCGLPHPLNLQISALWLIYITFKHVEINNTKNEEIYKILNDMNKEMGVYFLQYLYVHYSFTSPVAFKSFFKDNTDDVEKISPKKTIDQIKQARPQSYRWLRNIDLVLPPREGLPQLLQMVFYPAELGEAPIKLYEQITRTGMNNLGVLLGNDEPDAVEYSVAAGEVALYGQLMGPDFPEDDPEDGAYLSESESESESEEVVSQDVLDAHSELTGLAEEAAATESGGGSGATISGSDEGGDAATESGGGKPKRMKGGGNERKRCYVIFPTVDLNTKIDYYEKISPDSKYSRSVNFQKIDTIMATIKRIVNIEDLYRFAIIITRAFRVAAMGDNNYGALTNSRLHLLDICIAYFYKKIDKETLYKQLGYYLFLDDYSNVLSHLSPKDIISVCKLYRTIGETIHDTPLTIKSANTSKMLSRSNVSHPSNISLYRLPGAIAAGGRRHSRKRYRRRTVRKNKYYRKRTRKNRF
jgi:hypothetical protein